MRIAVTGASGLIGQQIVKVLVSQGHHVTAYFHSRKPAQASILPNLTWSKLSLDIPHEVATMVQNHEVVVHAAAKVSFRRKDARDLYETNVRGTALVVDSILQLAPQVRLVHMSSVAALGSPHKEGPMTGWTDEQSKWDSEASHTLYAKSKADAELEVWRGVQEGLNTIILNPALVLGYSPSGGSSSQLVDYVLKGKSFYTHGTLNYVDVADVANAVAWAVQSDVSRQRLVLCAGQISYHQFFNQLAAALNKKAPNLELTPFLGALGWRVSWFLNLFGIKTNVTKDTVTTAFRKSKFSGSVYTSISGNAYTALQETLTRLAKEVSLAR